MGVMYWEKWFLGFCRMDIIPNGIETAKLYTVDAVRGDIVAGQQQARELYVHVM